MTKDVKKAEQGQGHVVATPSIEKVAKFLDLYGFKDIPQAEKELFIESCMMNNLNPFKREIYLSVYGQGANRQVSMITGYEVYIKRAELSGRLKGWNVKTEPCTTTRVKSNGDIYVIDDLKAVLTIQRDGFDSDFTHEAKLSSSIQKTREGRVTQFWLRDPEFMLKKVAISQGFRLCFPEILAGMPYTKDEMPDYSSETVDVPAEVLEEQKKPEVKKISAKSFTKIVLKLDNLEVLPSEIISYIKSEKIKLTPEQKAKLTELKSLDSERYEQVVEKVKSGEWVAEQAAEFALTEDQIVGINSLSADLPE